MKFQMSTCLKSCLTEYAIFGVFLALAIIIAVAKTNHSLFININSMHQVLPVIVWKFFNIISYRKYLILPILLILITYKWQRDKLVNILILIALYFVVFGALKIIVGEARPYVVLDQNSFYWLNLYEDAEGSAFKSFPSGHTGNMAIFAFAISNLFFQNKKFLQFLMLLLVIMTALTRICTGWHWPLDVITSGLIGYLLVKFCLYFKFDKNKSE